MMLFKRLLVLSIATFMVSQAAWAGPKFSILGGVNKGLQAEATLAGATIGPSLGYQGGLEAGFDLSPYLGFDVGALYTVFNIKTTVPAPFNIDSTASFKYIDIPAQFRIKLGKVFSIGAGGFYDVPLDSGNEANYGYLGSLRISFPMGSSAFFVDGRYAGGLKTPDAGEKTKGWQAMAGITFGGKK
jgi:hypothetical protein